jgi:hypothetical protein
MGIGAVAGVPIGILEFALLFGALVAIGRRFRRVFAPETQPDSDTGASPPRDSAA